MLTRDDQIAIAVDKLDTRDFLAQDAAWTQLRPLGYGIVVHLLKAYPRLRTWQGRMALAYYSTRYARISKDALRLGLLALTDKSYVVRDRACGLLAYGMHEDALPHLRRTAQDDARELVRHSALAACNAIIAGNHNLFIDRSLSGTSFWMVNPGDQLPDGQRVPLPSHFERFQLGIRPVPSAADAAG